jgi:hypothetical protein
MDDTRPPTDPEVMKALGTFAAKVAVPILYDDPKGGDQIGTGTLVTADDRIFLVTAAHLFKNLNPERFAIPSVHNKEIWSLGRCDLLMPTDDQAFDVAVVELLEEATIERAKAGWKILTLENTGLAASFGLFVLCGFPSELSTRREDLIHGRRIVAFTGRMPEPPDNADQPIHPALDLFFFYDAELVCFTKTTIKSPDLKGCSGASIWEYREPPGISVWTSEQCLRAVGVQCSFRSGQYFRAKSWAVVFEIMRKYDDKLAAVINDYKQQ